MIPCRILISDVWSIHNAGDRAILEALLLELRRRWPQANITVAARFPETCTGLGPVTVLRDPLAFDAAALQAQIAHRYGSDAALDALCTAIESADLVVSTGGYFLNASPNNAFEFVFLSRLLRYQLALDRGIPVALLAQSFGPFTTPQLQHAARSTLARVPLITARDVDGFAALHFSGIAPQCMLTADMAALLPVAPEAEVDAAVRRWNIPPGAFAISVRQYPGTPVGAFAAVAQIADRIVEKTGLPILLIGTTVPPAQHAEIVRTERALGNDDSLALAEVLAAMRHKDRAVLVNEALPPRVLKGVLGRCHAFLATRMHAAILATTAGTPTLGIAYEPKVIGWFDQLGLPQMVLPLSAMNAAELECGTNALLEQAAALRAHLEMVRPEVEQRARMNFDALELLCAALPEPAGASVAPSAEAPPAAADARQSWESESHHYDTLHTRLRKVAEFVDSLPGTRVLDIGCSAGTLGAALQPRWTYHGCDISASAVASAPRGTCVAWDLETGLPPFDGQPYDVITASGILEYIADVPKLLRTAQARLKLGGSLVVSYFNMQHVSRRGTNAFRHEHWKNNWSAAQFREQLEQAGFSVATTTFSTRGNASAPDVRDEAAVLAAEAAQDWSATNIDDLAHTLIYTCTSVAATPHCDVSVVIPAWNRLDLLAPVLEGFVREATGKSVEIIVVDDGSEPPVATLLAAMGQPACVRVVRHEKNSGRGAALNTGFAQAHGDIVIVCDSDIVPEPNFIDDHVRFHAHHRDAKATCCGALVWGVDAGLLGRLLGARSNPRLEGGDLEGADAHGAFGPVGRSLPWTQWYTDNWSFKRAGFSAEEMRFDSSYRAWGFEDLELGRRLALSGATNTLMSAARGRHLKPATFDGLRSCFARSVPNLLLLAQAAPTESAVRDWMGCRCSNPKALAAAENLVAAHWRRLETLERNFGMWDSAVPEDMRRFVATALSDALFRIGVARGFANNNDSATSAASADPTPFLMDFAPLATACMLLGIALGDEEPSWDLMRTEVTNLQKAARQPAAFEINFLKRIALHTDAHVGQAASAAGA